ncbi:MAG: ATP-binding protein [Bacteroidota bacterium]|jgi:predicted AAA+ superfamily ATPase
MIRREMEQILAKKWPKGKALVLLGARQTGKTTLVNSVLPANTKILHLTGDDQAAIGLLEKANLETLRSRLGGYEYVFIDEAQRIPNIGVTAKLIVDHLPHLKLILTGSSSLELAEGTYESLTGRKREYHLYPISWNELSEYLGPIEAMGQLETRLIYGMYPEVVTSIGNESAVLQELCSSYLYRDLLNFKGIRKPRLLEKILQALSWQVGQEVSLSEIAQLVDADKATVDQYIDLLEKACIVFRLNPLSRNMRNEIKKFSKVYFWDTGIRNAVIANMAPLHQRSDAGQLFENFIIAERKKKLSYNAIPAKSWFWRTQAQQEIDYVEELNGTFEAVEIKWNPKTKVKFPASFIENYQSQNHVIHRENFDLWLK